MQWFTVKTQLLRELQYVLYSTNFIWGTLVHRSSGIKVHERFNLTPYQVIETIEIAPTLS